MSRYKGAIALVASVLAVTTLALAQQQPKPEEETIGSLLGERERVLNTLVNIARIEYEDGMTSLDQLIAAERRLLEAKLESTVSRDDRIEILKSQLDLSQKLESHLAELADIGDVPDKELLTAKVSRMNAHLELLREKQAQ